MRRQLLCGVLPHSSDTQLPHPAGILKSPPPAGCLLPALPDSRQNQCQYIFARLLTWHQRSARSSASGGTARFPVSVLPSASVCRPYRASCCPSVSHGRSFSSSSPDTAHRLKPDQSVPLSPAAASLPPSGLLHYHPRPVSLP